MTSCFIYGCLFNSFSAKSWVARERRTLHIEKFLVLVDDSRYAYIDDDFDGPIVGDMFTFLCGCPEFCRKEKSLTMFRRSCLCIGHFTPELPNVKFGSAVAPSSGPELSEITKPVQRYFLSFSVQNKIFTDRSSNIECVELLNGFTGNALHSGFDVQTYVDFCDKEWILKNLVGNCKENRSADCVERDNLSFIAPETLCAQNPIPRQRPKIDSAKVKTLLHYFDVTFHFSEFGFRETKSFL